MSTVKKTPGRFAKVWGAPIALGVLSLVGLIAALVGDGVMDAVSYLLLAVQLVVIVWYVAKRTR
jgi:CHASE2 domain-containing sensor protein